MPFLTILVRAIMRLAAGERFVVLASFEWSDQRVMYYTDKRWFRLIQRYADFAHACGADLYGTCDPATRTDYLIVSR